MKEHACMARTNPAKKLLWLVFYFVSCSAIEGLYCSTWQNFSHQNKQAQEACNTGINIFFPFTLLNNWSLLFLEIATYSIRQEITSSFIFFKMSSLPSSPNSSVQNHKFIIPWAFSTATYTRRPVNDNSLTMPMTVKGTKSVSERMTD